jgi:hypothetical protein
VGGVDDTADQYWHRLLKGPYMCEAAVSCKGIIKKIIHKQIELYCTVYTISTTFSKKYGLSSKKFFGRRCHWHRWPQYQRFHSPISRRIRINIQKGRKPWMRCPDRDTVPLSWPKHCRYRAGGSPCRMKVNRKDKKHYFFNVNLLIDAQ